MNTHDLFDRLASELAASGATEETSGGVRTLLVDGTPFARHVGQSTEVYLPEGSPARVDAVNLEAVTESANGWLAVSDRDVSVWPTLFQQALTGIRS